MGLKQSVVLVNEFTTPTPGGGGSRGGTPGDYINRYMARELATEPVAPIKRFDADAFITKYMARDAAVERTDLVTVDALKSTMRKDRGSAGVAFGYGSVSLSDEQLRAASRDVQNLFDAGKTVLKTVISFDEAYLKKHGLVPQEFTLSSRGDYRGNLDQLKLRMAVINGVERMGRSHYDDLRYVGVIQVDTKHVHCHLAMVDAGVGQVMPDGTQRGKISERSKSLLRRGIDSFLDEKRYVKHLASAVSHERTNVTTYVRKWAHTQMLHDSLPQVLVASLPADRRLWRAGTNNREMRQANIFVRTMVESILAEPESPMEAAMAQVYEYANFRRTNEDLNQSQWERLVNTGREQIVAKGVNAVYATLAQLPDDALHIRTPVLEVLGMDYEELAVRATTMDPQDDLVGFAYRLRSYSSRIEEHSQAQDHYREQVAYWRTQDRAGMASPASRALYDFYQEEEEYHRRCLSKYRHFVPAFSTEDFWLERWTRIQRYADALVSLESMSRDTSLKAMTDAGRAEQIGYEVYGQRGGHLVAQNTQSSRAELRNRIREMRQNRAEQIAAFRDMLLEHGYTVEITRDPETGVEQPLVEAGDRYPFEAVKGLDLHRMTYDFGADVVVGETALTHFREWAARRAKAVAGARAYLESSDQGYLVDTLPEQEIAVMTRMAQRIEEDPQHRLPSKIAELERHKVMLRRSPTIPLIGEDLDAKLREGVALATNEPLVFTQDAAGGLSFGDTTRQVQREQ